MTLRLPPGLMFESQSSECEAGREQASTALPVLTPEKTVRLV